MCGMMAIGLIGGAISAVGAIASANAQAQALKDQAAWQERQAGIEQTKTSYEIQQERRRTQAALGQMQVGYAASGIQTGAGGTPEQVSQALVQEREMDVQARRFQGSEDVNKLNWEAQQNRQQAKAVKTAGMLNAMSSIVGSFSGMSGGSGGTSLSGAFNMGASQPVASPTIATMPPAPSVSGGGAVAAPALNPYGTGFYVGDPRRRF